MSIHIVGVLVLTCVFVVGTWLRINIGALALTSTFIIGLWVADVPMADLYRGFPVDLLVLLVAVTYLFAIAARNGTIEWLVTAISRVVGGRRAFLPWIVFGVAAIPTTAGALGSAGVALLAPIALRLAERYEMDRRLIALMVLHGAACGNFSPINVLGAIVHEGMEQTGSAVSPAALFFANVAYNVGLAVIVYFFFRGHRLGHVGRSVAAPEQPAPRTTTNAPLAQRFITLSIIVAVAAASLVFGLGIGVLALIGAVALQLVFPGASRGAERDIAWDVVLLVCGIVTYMALLQRLGTVDAVGSTIAGLGSPLLGALLLCAVGAVTSAFASSAGILGAMMLLAAPFIAQDGVSAAGFVVALAISVTVVDSSPFSTAGALVVANAKPEERAGIYRGLLVWGAIMAVTAPVLTWALFILGTQ